MRRQLSIRAGSTLLRLGHSLCLPELVNHRETVSAAYDPLHVGVDVPRRDDESVALPVNLVVLANCQLQ